MNDVNFWFNVMSLLDLSTFEQAIAAFEKACVASNNPNVYALSPTLQEVIKAGVIQHFEFTYELSWKFIKRWLEKNYGSQMIDGITRRELYRLAQESQLIDDVDEWMFYHQARNKTSHTYHADMAQEIYDSSLTFLPIAKNLIARLKDKND